MRPGATCVIVGGIDTSARCRLRLFVPSAASTPGSIVTVAWSESLKPVETTSRVRESRQVNVGCPLTVTRLWACWRLATAREHGRGAEDRRRATLRSPDGRRLIAGLVGG